jgi:hypothetical protein
MHTKFLSENLKGGDQTEDVGVGGGDNVRLYLREIRWQSVDCIHLARDRDQWRSVVNTVMNLCVP